MSLPPTLILAGIGPVFFPPNRLPAALVALGRLSPATYAGSAVRQTLLGPLEARRFLDRAGHRQVVARFPERSGG